MANKFGDNDHTDEMGGISILATVAQQISTLNPRVEEQVVDALVEREVEKRSNAIILVLDKITTFEKELKKNKADQVSLDETGKIIFESFSRKNLEARNKLKGQIKKHTDAINKALLEKDYSNVYQLANEKPGDTAKNTSEGGSED